MLIPCTDIASHLKKSLILQVAEMKAHGVHPRLLAILLGDSAEQQSYLKIKKRIADEIGVEFVLWHLTDLPRASHFHTLLEAKIMTIQPHGVLIQQPLPTDYHVKGIFSQIPPHLDIEGLHNDAFAFPLVQACMLGLAWSYRRKTRIESDIWLSFAMLPFVPDIPLITWARSKSIVIAGRGSTTGNPIARYFEKLEIPFAQTNSKTVDPDSLYRAADIIITGVGKQILHSKNIKDGVVLLNFGLHNVTVDGKIRLRGDYDEAEIEPIASLYTRTPGGLGPIDVLCMYGNLIQSIHQGNSKQEQ